MCDMLKLRTFIDLRAQSSTLPAPFTNRPSTRSNVKHLLSSPPFLSCTQCWLWVRLCYGGLFMLCTAWVRETALHCMHELSSRFNWWDRLLSLSLSLSTPHHPAPRSAAVNESGLIFLYLLHTAYNLGDEIDQENKRSYSLLLHLLFYLFDCQSV